MTMTVLDRAQVADDAGRVTGERQERPDPEVPERARRRTFTAQGGPGYGWGSLLTRARGMLPLAGGAGCGGRAGIVPRARPAAPGPG